MEVGQKLLQSWPNVVGLGQMLANISSLGPNLARIDQSWSKLARNWLTSSKWPKLVRRRPIRANIGPKVAQVGQSLPKLGQIWAPGKMLEQGLDNNVRISGGTLDKVGGVGQDLAQLDTSWPMLGQILMDMRQTRGVQR